MNILHLLNPMMIQKNRVAEICSLATEYVITTCKDYKNQEFKDREFSIPALN